MNFSDYSKRLNSHLSGIHNQSHFIGCLFNAAGSTFFPVQGSYGADDNQRKLYAGSRVFNKNMKASFPSPIDRTGLITFFDTHIGNTSLPLIMAEFGIPKGEVQNKERFIEALCIQFQSFVSEATNNVDDIVASEYCRLLRESGAEVAGDYPLYPGDDVLLVSQTPTEPHSVNCYELFKHSWMIKNTGKITWEGRRLECTNQVETRLRAVITIINIPKLKPGGDICLTAQFDSRGFEGTFESLWEIKDSEGRHCFPHKGKVLKTVATVTHWRSTTAEV